MKRKKYKDWLWIVSVAIFIICTLEGIFWYWKVQPIEGSLYIRLLAYIQNGVKAFKLDPDIKLKEVAAQIESMEPWLQAFSYLYCTTVIIAPFCTIAALTFLILKPVYYMKGIKNRSGEKKVLLIGNGETKKRFAMAIPGKECRVYSIETVLLSEADKLNYLKKGIRCFTDYDDREQKKVYRQAELMTSDIVLLCDDDVMKNLITLKNIIEFYAEHPLDEAKKKAQLTRQDIYVTCEDPGMREVFHLCYDAYMNKVRTEKNLRSFDLFIVDVKERAVRKMFDGHPLFAVNRQMKSEDPGALDVHLGIVGFGSFGQHTLLQALELAAFSKDSRIVADIFDKNIDETFQNFLKRFSTAALELVERNVPEGGEIIDYRIELPSKESRSLGVDGTVVLRFWGCNTENLDFRRKMLYTAQEMPYTYVVVAMSQDKEMLVSIKEICRMVYGDKKIGNVPVVVRTKEDSPVVELFTDGKDSSVSRQDVSTVDQQKDIYSLESLTDNRLVERAKYFNARYSRISDFLEMKKKEQEQMSGRPLTKEEQRQTMEASMEEALKTLENWEPTEKEIEDAWNDKTAFKKESSMAQAMHQDTKQWLVKERGLSDKEEREALEHRRWCLFMILNGYCYGQEKNELLKTHDCLSTWENLKKERPDTLEYDNTPYLIL